MKIWVTSDTHFSHANIIKYCNRPFKDVIEMDNKLVEFWNEIVSPKDTVYHLGDVIFSKNHDILKKLNGNINFLFGNHDKDPTWKGQDYFELKYKGELFIFFHYPLLTWNKARYGSIHCHGHCHGTINHLNVNLKRFDVGVDVYGYKPVLIDQIIDEAKMKPKIDVRDYD